MVAISLTARSAYLYMSCDCYIQLVFTHSMYIKIPLCKFCGKRLRETSVRECDYPGDVCKLCRYAKFRVDRSNRCWNVVILDLLKWRLSAILELLDAWPTTSIWWYLSLYKIWLESISSFNNMQVLTFNEFDLKMLMHSCPKWSFSGRIYLLNRQQSHRDPKGHLHMCRSTSSRHGLYHKLL